MVGQHAPYSHSESMEPLLESMHCQQTSLTAVRTRALKEHPRTQARGELPTMTAELPANHRSQSVRTRTDSISQHSSSHPLEVSAHPFVAKLAIEIAQVLSTEVTDVTPQTWAKMKRQAASRATRQANSIEL